MDWQSILTAVITSGVITTIINFIFEYFRNNREIKSQKHIKAFNDKLAIYALIVDLFADFLAELTAAIERNQKLPHEKVLHFDKIRMKTFGYLCIYGDQRSIDAHEHLVEYIFEVIEGSAEGEWPEVRSRALALLNSFRSDFDPNLPSATYNGNR